MGLYTHDATRLGICTATADSEEKTAMHVAYPMHACYGAKMNHAELKRHSPGLGPN